ncbi:MAG: SusD/RagB family nutrient-binding outer membrane lipoprotein [Dysgonomonas sp.]|nr:SusD/RagB family nutrient-binding outer membrane lipoprotein [Dysgonomonas sp.]
MKRNMIYRKYSLIVMTAICMLLISGCTDNFDDINRPRTPTEEEAKGDFFYIGVHYRALQNGVILSPANRYQYDENLSGQPYARYLTITKDNWNMTNFGVFNASDQFLNNLFNFHMTDIYGAWFELKRLLTEEDDKQNHYSWAWAELLRVAAVHRITDIYGPIPYSKIKENSGTLQVAYDSQEDVYKGLFEDLNKAINILTEYVQSGAASQVSAFKEYDMVYGGDFAKWLKFANSLKLRMAMRIAYVDEENSKKYAKEALTNPGGIITSNDDNAQLSVFPNPLFTMWGAYADTRACAEIMAYMKGYEDPRLGLYFQKAAGKDEYLGMRLGIAISNHAWATGFSAPQTQENDPLLWMNAAEMAFIKAEGKAVWKWDFVTESAGDLYNEGIKLSFTQWGSTDAAATSYYGNSTRKPAAFNDDGNAALSPSSITIKWDESATDEIKQERILTQKWLALFPLGNEAWAENRRTGYPRFFPTVVSHNPDPLLKTRGASRIPYAPQEALDNSVNYSKALELLGSNKDDYSTRLWWDKKANKPNF